MKVHAVVYTGPHCHACAKAILWLKSQGVVVEEKSYTEALFDIYGLPTIIVGDKALTGFNPKELKKALRGITR